MNITGYPFQFLALGDPTTGGAAVLSVSLVQGYDSEEFDQLRCVVCWFAEIGGVGGFGGDTVHPSASACELVSPEPSIGPRVEWHFRSLAIDPRSLVVLANLIRDTELEVVQVTVTASGGDLPQKLYPSRLPTTLASPSFLARGKSIEPECAVGTGVLERSRAAKPRPDCGPDQVLVHDRRPWWISGTRHCPFGTGSATRG